MKTTVKVEITQWVRIDGALRLRDVATEVDLELDMPRIARMLGSRALKNRSHRSIGLNGAIVARTKARQSQEA